MAIYPGTFDPITKGHIDVIASAIELFDAVIIVVADNEYKNPWLSLDDRLATVRLAVADFSKVSVCGWAGLTTDFMRENKINTIIRGIRSADDVTYELQLANMNQQMMPQAQTVFLPTLAKHALISSSIAREIIRMKGDASSFVNQEIIDYIEELQ